MQKQLSLLHSVAVITAASLSLSMLSVAHAGQRTDGTTDAKKHTARKHTAPTHHVKQRETEIPPKIYGAAPDLPTTDSSGCTWPYQNQFPPCMSTWPEGSPDYHGSNGY